MEIVHNVTDKRSQRIGSWEVVPLVFEDLGKKDLGRTVIYADRTGKAEAGTLKGWGINGLGRYIDALYHQGETTARADPDMVPWFGVRELGVEELLGFDPNVRPEDR